MEYYEVKMESINLSLKQYMEELEKNNYRIAFLQERENSLLQENTFLQSEVRELLNRNEILEKE